VNRKLLFLGIFLGLVAVASTTAILLLTNASANNIGAYSNIQIALQISFFHAAILMFLAQVKRKYTDQDLVNIGYIFTISTLVLILPACIAVFIGDSVVFEFACIAGMIGLVSGWIALTKSFYDVHFPKRM